MSSADRSGHEQRDRQEMAGVALTPGLFLTNKPVPGFEARTNDESIWRAANTRPRHLLSRCYCDAVADPSKWN